MELPKNYWGIFRDGKLITSGSKFGMTVEHLEELAANYPNGQIKYSETSFGTKQTVGTIFGMTFDQIQDKQQKL